MEKGYRYVYITVDDVIAATSVWIRWELHNICDLNQQLNDSNIIFFKMTQFPALTSSYSQHPHHSDDCWIDWNDLGFYFLQYNADDWQHYYDNIQLVPPKKNMYYE